jgi:uncharacterized protein YodC (DUF2158 family)
MNGIKPGDVVVLKSGGPVMTVERVYDWNGVPTAKCDWFDGNKAIDGSFPVASLKHAEQ